MHAWRNRALIGVAAFTASACAFILDFDELQKENQIGSSGGDNGSGNSTSGGSGAELGMGGAAGGDDGPCGSCDDGNACTQDSCDTTADPPECMHEYAAGIVADNFSQTLTGGSTAKLTLATGPDAFYLSRFKIEDVVPDVTLYRLMADSDDLETVGNLSSLREDADPVSAAGLVADTSASLRLRAYVALKDRTGPGLGVYLATFDRDMAFVDSVAVEDSYDAGVGDLVALRSPIAWFVGGRAWGAWPNTAGGISLHSPDHDVEALGFSSPTAAQRPGALAPLASGSDPGVLFTGSTEGVYAQLRTQAGPKALSECTLDEGAYLSAATVNVGITGFWLTSWTKVSASVLVTEASPVFCDNGCNAPAADCAGGDSTAELVRNQAYSAFFRSGDPAGVTYLATVTPYLAAGSDADTASANLELTFSRIDFGTMPLVDDAMVDTLGQVALSTQETAASDLFNGPDYPVVGTVAPDKLLVGWLEPDSDGNSAVRLQRYTMCFAED